MKILSWNVNGIRAVVKGGFFKWLKESGADIVCLQETKIGENELTWDLLYPSGYFAYFNCAAKKGYSGVAVFTKEKPLSVEKKIGFERFDQEGRFLQLEFPGFILINLYLPHGDRSKKNLDYKLEVYEKIFDYLQKPSFSKRFLLIGDFNIAHQEIDLARPKQNEDNIMFTPQERKQIDRLIKLGFVDSFRKFHQEGGHYTWWSYAHGAKKNNIGWRIDYAFVSKDLLPKLKSAFILPEIPGSDHCPVGILTKDEKCDIL